MTGKQPSQVPKDRDSNRNRCIFVLAILGAILLAVSSRKMTDSPGEMEQLATMHKSHDLDGIKKLLTGRVITFSEEEKAKNLEGAIHHEEIRNIGAVRLIKPKTMVTMDYNPDRLNIKVDDNSKVIDAHFS
eukprot:139747_1